MKLSLGKILKLAAIVLGLVAVLMIFAPAIVPKSDYKALAGDNSNYSGLQVAFGDEKYSLAASAYSLALILPVLGLIVAVAHLFGKGGKIAPFAAAALFIAGGIVYFLPLETVMSSQVHGDAIDLFRDTLKLMLTTGVGAIVGGILSILAGVASAATWVIKD